jgi:hypothetical protein
MRKRLQLLHIVLVTAMVGALQGTAVAAINIANGAPIIGGSGDYSGFPFNSGSSQFPSSAVTDGYLATPDNDTGSITEVYGAGYWLGHNLQNTGYFVLDLGSPYSIGQIELFNTRNGSYGDRGTGSFTISASNSIAPGPPSTGMDLVSPVQIVSGTLSVPPTQILIGDSFTASNPGPFQYLRFDALSIGANPFPFGLNGVGLNEIRVFQAPLTAVPEPTALVIGGAIGAICLGLRRWIHDALVACGT